MKRSPKKRGLSKPVPPRKSAANARGKTVAVTERAGVETRAKTKVRLDIALVERGLARIAREGGAGDPGRRRDGGRAAGGQGRARWSTPGRAHRAGCARPRFVSRGGDKLAHALAAFTIEPRGRVAIDVGASTGGFTHCLLEQGAVKVYAVDVGQGQLDAKLRADGAGGGDGEDQRAQPADRLFPRVARSGHRGHLVHLAREGAPAVFNVLTSKGEAVVLVKPQFEVGKGQVGKGGVVRDSSHHRAVVARVARFAVLHGWHVRGVTASPLKGPKGNREFFLLLTKTGRTLAELDALITQVTAEEVAVP